MRSELVTGATKKVENRYALTLITAKAVRALHRPRTRISDTTNEVLRLFAVKSPLEHAAPPRIAKIGKNERSYKNARKLRAN
jgi:hypothetical protein